MIKPQGYAIVLLLLISMDSLPQGARKQTQLIYDSEKAPVRVRLTPSSKHVEVVNNSDLDVESLALGCISESAGGKVSVKARIESIENFDLKHIDLTPADRKNSTFSFFSFPVTDPSVRQCKDLGLRLAVVEVAFADKSFWRITEQ